MIKGLELSFSDKGVTPWGGMTLMWRMLQKIGFNDAVRGVELPEHLVWKIYHMRADAENRIEEGNGLRGYGISLSLLPCLHISL